jgi:hypothetical protein
MSTELHWPRRSTFVESSADGEDSEERRYVGPGTFDVPDELLDSYLDRGWERPDADESTEAPEAADQDASESDAEPEAEGFDAEGFVDESWQAVKAAIENGEADGHLEAIKEAEQNREGDPRESVIEALEDRAG